MKIGEKYSSSVAPTEQSSINAFGALHGTNGRSHTDPEYAKNSVFKGVIVQGALVMAPVLDMAEEIFGSGWHQGSEIETKFVSFTRPGDRIQVEFEVTRMDGGMTELAYRCLKDDGTIVQVGTLRRLEG